MDDLVAFLRARLDEDEQVAYAAGMQLVDESDAKWVTHGQRLGEHIARHDPARVLREVEAKRRILDAGKAKHQHETTGEYIRFGTWESCSDDCSGNVWYEVVKLLALPYDYHPDYRSEWAVTP